MGAQFTLGRIAEALGATLEGDPARVVRGVAPLDVAGPEHVSFLANARYARAAARSAAGAVVVGREVDGLPQALLRVDSPQAAMISLLRLFPPEPPAVSGIHPTAVIAGGASVHPTAFVGACAVVERDARVGARSRVGALCFVGTGAALGDDVVLHPRVVVQEGVVIGDRVIVHARKSWVTSAGHADSYVTATGAPGSRPAVTTRTGQAWVARTICPASSPAMAGRTPLARTRSSHARSRSTPSRQAANHTNGLNQCRAHAICVSS